jgi:hypothetical protein
MAALRSFILPPFLELSVAEQVCSTALLAVHEADETPDERQSSTVGAVSASGFGSPV